MERKLAGRRIVITGGASGIGRGVAELFAMHGAHLALLDRSWSADQAVPAGSLALTCDVTDRATVSAAMAEADEVMGGIDGVVNAAGVLDITPFAELTHESWDRMVAVNLTGPFNVVKAALPYLAQQGRATIVNIGSVSGLMPMAGTAGYSASKGGLHMFTKGIACDLGPNIRANTICPGTIRTAMTRYLWENPEHLSRASERAALKRIGDPIDIAKAALFLSCEDSSFTTGTELPVDGGFSWR